MRGPRRSCITWRSGRRVAEFEATAESIRRAGVARIDPPRGAPEGGLWVRDPDGNVVNVRPEAGEAPPADPPLTLNSPGHVARVAARGCPEGLEAHPRRLGHVLLFTGALDRQVDFYTRVLGLKLSDRCDGIIAFLRCSTDHHNLALLKSDGPGFHHGSFEVGSIDEIALGAQRMLRQRAAARLGPRSSRHRLELLLLHPRSVGLVGRVLPRPRPHPGSVRVAAARFPGSRRALPLGAAGPRGFRPQPRAGELS